MYCDHHLTLYHTVPTIYDPEKKSFENIMRKGKMLLTSIFSFSRNVFHPSEYTFQFLAIIYFVVCKSFQFGLV